MDDALDRLANEANELRRMVGGGNSATIQINAGGAGLWVAVTCCIVMLVCTVFMAAALLWVAMGSRDQGHQMNALYMSVPGLRELVQKQMSQNESFRDEEGKDE